MTLLIVESPNKIKKIKSILGNNYDISASVGHIMDLNPHDISIDIKNNFEPIYIINADKKDVVEKLRNLYKNATDLLIATDKDREGEMIAWSIAEVLKIDIKKAKRISFGEITKTELMNAVKNPKLIDMDMVNAQKARRELDRFAGYEISPVLQRTIGAKSAGRVQSVVVKIIVDREKEIREFLSQESSAFFTFKGTFIDQKKNSFNANMIQKTENKPKKVIKIKKTKKETEDDESEDEENNNNNQNNQGTKAKIISITNARQKMKLLSESKYTVTSITNKDSYSKPSPPFTTSTLQQDASSKLNMNAQRTMLTAQHLYEAGHITYMRTDSINLSDEILEEIKVYIIANYGQNHYQYMKYKAKVANTQEAHEAIRPTDIQLDVLQKDDKSGKIGLDEVRLYKLIWQRTVASQMANAKFDITTITITASKIDNYFFAAHNKKTVFEGYLAVYNNNNKEDNEEEENNHIAINKLAPIEIKSINGHQDYDKPPTRYNEAGLTKRLDPKDLNIGRPSTYASIMRVIQERDYVETKNMEGEEKDSIIINWEADTKVIKEITSKITIGKETKRLVPTTIGEAMVDFLSKHFVELMDYKFTAKMEKELDDVSNGKQVWWKVVEKFYNTIHPIVEELKTKIGIIKIENKSEKILGINPLTGGTITANNGMYGPYVKSELDKKCAKIITPLTINTITLEDALKLLEYPKILGKYNRKDVMLRQSQNGFYLTIGADATNRIAITEEEQADITIEKAKIIIDERNKIHYKIKDGKTTYTVITGQHGLFVNINNGISKYNVNIPASTDTKTLNLEKIKELIKKKKETIDVKETEEVIKPKGKVIVKGKKETEEIKPKVNKVIKPKTLIVKGKKASPKSETKETDKVIKPKTVIVKGKKASPKSDTTETNYLFD